MVAVDRDPVARELTAANAAALGLADRIGWSTPTSSTWWPDGDLLRVRRPRRWTRPDGRADGASSTPTGWSPPWSTVTTLLDRVPASVVKVAPGLDHDRVPDGIEAEWVSVGGSIVEALLWGRGLARTWRRATLVPRRRRARGHRRRRPGPAPVGAGARLAARARPGADPVRPDVAGGRRPGATLIDPTIAYLTSDAPADSPWVSSYRVTEVLPFNLKKLQALLRARGVGRVVVKKRGSPIEPETLARQLRGPGSGSAVVVVTRVAGAPTVLVCRLAEVPQPMASAQRLTTSIGSELSAPRSGADGATPAATSREPSAATIAPLSVHSRGLGTRSTMPAAAQRSSASARSRELAATPPPSTRWSTPWSRQARTALAVSTSATASWNDAATSATGTGSPARSRASTQRATAVFSPENEKS